MRSRGERARADSPGVNGLLSLLLLGAKEFSRLAMYINVPHFFALAVVWQECDFVPRIPLSVCFRDRRTKRSANAIFVHRSVA